MKASLLALAIALGAAQAPTQEALMPADEKAVLETDRGNITLRLRRDLAPKHVAHFVRTARESGYDGTTFHRIIPGGIIQGGDPLSKDPAKKAQYGTGGLGILKAEFSQAGLVRGVVAAVRRPSSVDSGGSQFFICLADQRALDGKYTVFGEVAEGMDVADAIGRTPVDGDRATERVEIKKVSVEPLPAR